MKLNARQCRILAVVWFAAAWFALLRENPPGGVPLFLHFDKAAHFALFFAQLWLMAKSCTRHPPYAVFALFTLAFALASELAQMWFTQTRAGDILDGIADLSGAATALWLDKTVRKNKEMPTQENSGSQTKQK